METQILNFNSDCVQDSGGYSNGNKICKIVKNSDIIKEITLCSSKALAGCLERNMDVFI